MVHGGAGAGKSTVINVLAQWVQKILEKEGNILLFTSIFLKLPRFPSIFHICSANKIVKQNYQTKLSKENEIVLKQNCCFSEIAIDFAHIFPNFCPQFHLILH